MTAGKGILHSEMPASDGDNIGLQLWINLKAKDKVSIPFKNLSIVPYIDHAHLSIDGLNSTLSTPWQWSHNI